MRESLNEKKIYFEVIRVFAIFLVLFNHTRAFHLPFATTLSGVEGFCCLFVSIADKVAVPLFFMVSGALLLHKEESLRKIFFKRVFRYALLILLFQIFHHIVSCFIYNQDVTCRSFLEDCLYAKSCNAATWFLYAYLAFILLLPFFRAMVKQMTDEHFLYLFALQLLTWAFVPFPETGLSKWMPFCNSVFLYVLAGYYLEHRVDISHIHRKHLLFLAFFSVVCILLSSAMCQLGRVINGEELFTQKVLCFKGGILIPCIAIFLCVKKVLFRPLPLRVTQVICALGSATFTIMLCENVLRYYAGKVIHHLVPSSSVYLTDILVVILALAIGFPIGVVLKQIPGVRKLV